MHLPNPPKGITEHTNIRNLPDLEDGKLYFTELGYSQSYPWAEISRTAKTVTLAKVDVAGDPDWKERMDFEPGGFCGHCANQGEQTWLFEKIDTECTKTIRLTKDGWAYKGTRFIEGRAREHYDYNF